MWAAVTADVKKTRLWYPYMIVKAAEEEEREDVVVVVLESPRANFSWAVREVITGEKYSPVKTVRQPVSVDVTRVRGMEASTS